MTAMDIQKNNIDDSSDLLLLSRDIVQIRTCSLLFTVRNPVFVENIVNRATSQKKHLYSFYVFIFRWYGALDISKMSIKRLSFADQLLKFLCSGASLEYEDGWNPYSRVSTGEDWHCLMTDISFGYVRAAQIRNS